MSTKIAIGSRWVRRDDGETVVVVSYDDDGDPCYRYTCRAFNVGMRYVKTEATFLKLFAPEQVPTEAAVDWSYAEADRLQAAAYAAVREYNAYVESKPSKSHCTLYLPEDW